jgi:hypothetical protein
VKRDAAWLLRRYRDGGAPDWRVQVALERELARLVNERHQLSGELSELRRLAPALLESFDEATDRALQWQAERRFAEAYQELRRAARDLTELWRFVRANAELERAAKAVERIADRLDPCLADLTTTSVLHRLAALARELLEQGEVRKARFVALLLQRQAAGLQATDRRQPGPGLARRLAAGGGDPACEPLQRLVREGYVELAERLAEDLEAEAAVADRRRAAAAPDGPLAPLLQELAEVRRTAEVTVRSLAQWCSGGEPAET